MNRCFRECRDVKKKKKGRCQSDSKESGRSGYSERKNRKIPVQSQGEISMSDAISKLIEPYKQDAPDYNSFNNLVTFACIAWNTSILPDEKREKALQEMLKVLPGTLKDRRDLYLLLTELMERKRSLFPNVSRMIVEHKVTEQGDTFHIAIASTMEKKVVQK
jgi:hypothetical protein